MRVLYEIYDIEKKDDLTEADSMRIGRRVYPVQFVKGAPVMLVHAENEEKAIMTSKLQEVTCGEIGSDIIEFETRNTTYRLRKIEEAI